MSQLALTLIQNSLRTQNPYLDLGRCGLTDALVAEGTETDIALRQCTHLKTLILSNKWVDWEKKEWVNSQNTGENNFFTTHPPALPLLSQLEVLRCGGSYEIGEKWQITNISFMATMKDLVLLDLSFNQISDINPLQNLNNLQQLYISFNQISDINLLQNLNNLQQLYILSNQISDIKALEKLNNLQQLSISANKISNLKPLLPLIQREKNPLQIVWKELYETKNSEITIKHNPLTHPPVEIIQQGNAAILAWFEEVKRTGIQKAREAKLILTGSGEVGKTSLRIRLNDKNAPLPKQDERTRRVEVELYSFRIDTTHSFDAHVWDFGGQQILHHFHRFFMNEDALYILMTDTSREQDNFDYWLQNIQLFGKQSPILFVQNIKNGIQRSLNISHYKQHFAIKEDLLEVNIKTNEGLARLEKAIQYHIQTLPITQRDIPTSWFKVREALENEKANQPIVNYDKLVEFCKKEGIVTKIGIEAVGKFLHALGIILWYSENDTLREKIILQRHWATEGIFELIFHPEIQRKARFDKEMAQSIWDSSNIQENYAFHCHSLIAMMCEFRICYPQKDKKNAYIIPALLPAKPVNLQWKYEPRLRVVYQYTFMPQGISNYLAAEMHHHIVADSHIWSEGFYLHKEKSQAKIVEHKYVHQLEIILAGEEHQVWFGAIKDSIEKMHQDYAGIEPTLQIPCICNKCKTLTIEKRENYDYKRVIERKNSGIKDTIECRLSGENVRVQQLLDNLLPEKLQRNEEKRDKKQKGVKDLVSEGSLMEAISLLKGSSESTILSMDLEGCEKKYNEGILSYQEYSQKRNEVASRILRVEENQKREKNVKEPETSSYENNNTIPVPFHKRFWAKLLAILGILGVILGFTAALFGTLNDGVSFLDRFQDTPKNPKVENTSPKTPTKDSVKIKQDSAKIVKKPIK